jgi:UDP-glucose 4-epimerase
MHASDNAHVVVTGGAGFIGSHLCDLLTERRVAVHVVDDLRTGSLANLHLSARHLTFDHLSIGDPNAMEALAAVVAKSAMVYHLAGPVGVSLAQADPGATVRETVLAGAQIVELCRRYRRPLLFTSSSEVYGCTGDTPSSENAALALSTAPRFSYAAAKLAVEHMVTSLYCRDEIPSWVVRLFNIAGPRQRRTAGVMSAFAAAAVDPKGTLQIYGEGDQTRSFLHVRDGVDGLVRIAASSELQGRAINLGGAQPISMNALAQRITAECARQTACSYSSYATCFGEDFVPVQHRKPDTRLLRESTGWRPRFDLDDIIRDCITDARRALS